MSISSTSLLFVCEKQETFQRCESDAHLLRQVGHFHIDLDRIAVLQTAQQLSIVLQPFDRCRQQLLKPAWIDSLSLDKIVDTLDKIGMGISNA